MRIDHYEVQGELGRGGMGVVYRARDPLLARDVALKVFGPEAALDPELAARVQREAQAASRLVHPHLVSVLGAGLWQGRPYLVLELVAGESLRERLRRAGPLPLDEAARVVAEVARGLEHAHRAGVLHRDVKPENVLLDARGAARLTDFGLAGVTGAAAQRLTATGEVLGTPAAMAPEQALGDRARIGPRTDVYGLGVLLYEALVGEPPFAGASTLAVLESAVMAAAPSPRARRREVDAALERLVLACLAKAPEGRPPSAQAVADALDAWRAGHAAARAAGPGAGPGARPGPGSRAGGSGRAPLAAAALAVAALAGLAALAGAIAWARLRRAEEALADRDRRLAAAEAKVDELRRALEALGAARRDAPPAAPGGGPEAEPALPPAPLPPAPGPGPADPGPPSAADPVDPAAARALEGAEADLQAGRVAEARARLERLVEAAPSSRAWNDLGVARQRGGDAGGARAAYDQALALDPANASARGNRAELRAGAGDLRGAREDLDAALARAPADVRLLRLRAAVLDRLGDARAALADADQAVAAAPARADLLVMRGVLRARLGDHRGAVADCDAALRLAPGDASALVNRGVSRAELGDLAGAAADLEAGLDAGVDQAAQAWANLGSVRQLAGDDRGAVVAYDRALAADPEQPVIRVNRAASRLRLGDAAGAADDAAWGLARVPRGSAKETEAKATLAAARAALAR